MPGFNISAMTAEEQEKIAVDMMASAVAYKERMRMPVVPELVARDLPEQFREYFKERVLHYRQVSPRFPGASDPVYLEMAEKNKKT